MTPVPIRVCPPHGLKPAVTEPMNPVSLMVSPPHSPKPGWHWPNEPSPMLMYPHSLKTNELSPCSCPAAALSQLALERLSSSVEDAELQGRGLALLAALASRYPQSKGYLRSSGLTHIATALRQHASSATVSVFGLEAIIRITCDIPKGKDQYSLSARCNSGGCRKKGHVPLMRPGRSQGYMEEVAAHAWGTRRGIGVAYLSKAVSAALRARNLCANRSIGDDPGFPSLTPSPWKRADSTGLGSLATLAAILDACSG
jgi:hypothetical protein